MQTCSRCNATSPDTSLTCPHCQADLKIFSTCAVALQNFRQNQRVTSIRVNVAHDACPVCYEARGTFPKETAPALPHEGCSHTRGCRCTYEPVLNEIYP